jgi:inner membrane protein
MTGKTHVACGTTLMIALVTAYPSEITVMGVTLTTAVGLATVSVGSYLPDIDIPQSSLGKKHKFISKMLTHRGITHTLLGPAILFAGMYYLAVIPVLSSLIFGLFVGWVSHLMADICNKKGIPLFWPIFHKKIHIATFKTGTWQEGIFLLLWVGGLIAWRLLF